MAENIELGPQHPHLPVNDGDNEGPRWQVRNIEPRLAIHQGDVTLGAPEMDTHHGGTAQGKPRTIR